MLVILFAVLIPGILGHGMMLDPPNRSSLWRYDATAMRNYQDNQVFCGGYYVQWELNDGKCGLCGDTYSDAHPQENENTGLYGQGKIAAVYSAGSVIETEIWLTKNHLGSFTFSLCELEDVNAPESGEECFKPLQLEDGSAEFVVTEDTPEFVKVSLQLPSEQTCERCVLRWNYRAGNNWGVCGDGVWEKGCGSQETFRTCSDIKILESL